MLFGRSIGVGYFDEESGLWLFWLGDCEVKGGGVTHWMPMPDLPVAAQFDGDSNGKQ